jgi:hypothetical protein
MKRLIAASILSMSIAAPGLAGEEEHMEVTAPNECCQAPLPGGLGLIAGWTGASGVKGAGSASLKDAALKAEIKKSAEQKSKSQKAEEEKKQEQTEYDKFMQNNPSALAVFFRELGLSFRAMIYGGEVYKAEMKDENGNDVSIEDCRPGGPMNPNGVRCSEKKFELFVDPTDGREKWAFTFSVVEAKYNPRHYDANKNGYYPAVVNNKTISLVFETEADLIWQLQQVAAAR